MKSPSLAIASRTIGRPFRPYLGFRRTDELESAGGDVVVDLHVRVLPQVAGDQLSEGLGDHKADRLVAVTPHDGPERGFDPVEGIGDGLTSWRAHG